MPIPEHLSRYEAELDDTQFEQSVIDEIQEEEALSQPINTICDSEEIAREWDLVRAMGGSEEEASAAFEAIWHNNHSNVQGYLLRHTRDADLAEDLTQTAFMRFYETHSRYTQRGNSAVGALIMTMAKNLLKDHYKSVSRRRTSPSDIIESDASTLFYQEPISAEDLAVTSLERESLLRTVAKLSDDQQTCIKLRYFSDLSIAKSAKIMGKNETAVKQLRVRAIGNLRMLLGE